MTGDLKTFASSKPCSLPGTITVANGMNLDIQRSGTLQFTFPDSPPLVLFDALYVPKLSANLISVNQLVNQHCLVSFSPNGCLIQDLRTGKVIGRGRRQGELFILDLGSSSDSHKCFLAPSSQEIDSANALWKLWHRRLGHPHAQNLKSLFSSGDLLSTVDFKNNVSIDCESCALAKSHLLPFSKSIHHTTSPFELIHSDVWGPASSKSLSGNSYYVIFVDDVSRFTWVYFLQHKSEVFSVFKYFYAMVRTQFEKNIKILRTDSGGEYISKDFEHFLATEGVIHQKTCPHQSQQNGVAERKHRHIIETARALRLHANLPQLFWADGVHTAVYLINRMPTTVLQNQSPMQKLLGTKPQYDTLRVFGCTCYVLLPRSEYSKIDAKSAKCIFLGYSDTQKGYRCYDWDAKRMRISRNVLFFEDSFYFRSTTEPTDALGCLTPLSSYFDDEPDPSTRVPLAAPPPSPSPDPGIPSSSHIFPSSEPLNGVVTTRSGRVSKPPSRLSLLSSLDHISIPRSYKQAADSKEWTLAMQTELDALARNHTWDLVPAPSDQTVVGCKWVYTLKQKSDGTLDRYKARLVAQGFKQEYGIDYEETFAPVAKMTTVRTLLAVAAIRQWDISQMDVTNAFLNGELSETVYMKPPPGFSTSPSMVCKLRKALYGLKQAPRAWFSKLKSVLLKGGYRQSHNDYSLFISPSTQGTVFVLIYVDDLLITGDDVEGILQLKGMLQSSFQMKDLGHASYFLGLEISRNDGGYFLCQRKYTKEILDMAHLTDTTTIDTPMEQNTHYSKTDGEPLSDPTLYRRLVGSLVYLTVTRPDIAHAVHILSQFVSDPRRLHLTAVYRLLRYLRSTATMGLHYSHDSPTILRAFSDADYGGCLDTRRSTTGYCVFLGNSLLSWKSKKQETVSKSSTEAEYRAMSTTCSEVVWLRRLLADFGIHSSSPTPMYCDNESAVKIATNPIFHERTKHIEIDCHFVREKFNDGLISLPHVASRDQLADFFTKSQTKKRHEFFISKLLVDHHQFEGGC